MKSSYYSQVQPERDVTGDNFSKGQINFNWTMDSSGYFNPYKTFIKIRFQLLKRTGGNDVQLVEANNVAPNFLLADNLFQQIRMNINNQCVSEIGDYVAQVSALKTRMYKSTERLKNYEAAMNFASPSWKERVSDVASDANPHNETTYNRFSPRLKTTFECIWKPVLGFFDIDEFIPCCQGLFNLQLTPYPAGVFDRACIESNNADSAGKIPGSYDDDDNDYFFKIESMNMYLLKGLGEPINSKNLTLQFKECRCQTQNLTTHSIHQKTFQVHPRTQELTLAYQYPGASIDTNRFSASRFVANYLSNIGNEVARRDDLRIRRFWINFGNRQLPTPIPDPQYGDSTGAVLVDYLTQRYVETINYTNALNSPEPYQVWLYLGCYYHFSGYSENEKDDRVYVSSQFDSFIDNTKNPNVLLFDHWIKKVNIHISDSRIQNVKAY